MRHQKQRHKIGRAKGHRTRTLQALSSALIEHKRITTTEAKAKALRPFIEPLITRAKEDTQHNRRQVFRKLQNKHAVSELFEDVAVEVGDRPGGYTRVIKLGRRSGDGAEMAMIELVDYNDVQPETGSGGGRSRTRRGGGKGRRRSRSKSEAPSAGEQATPETSTTTTTSQRDDVEGAEEDIVEEPVAEEQKTPVPERTEPGAEEEQVARAEEITEERTSEEASEEQEDGEDDEEKS